MWSMDEIKDAAGSKFLVAVTYGSYTPEGTKSRIPKLARRGDKILENVAGKYRIAQKQKPKNERPLGTTDFVSAQALFYVGVAMGIHDVIRMSIKQWEYFFESAIGYPTKHIMRYVSEVVEALTGAIEINSGYETACAFVEDNVITPIANEVFVDTDEILRVSRQKLLFY